MVKASLAAGLLGLALFALMSGGTPLSVLLPLSLIGLAAALYLGRSMPKFLRVFMAVLAFVETLLAALLVADAFGLIAGDLDGYVPPPSMPVGATIFAFVIFGVSRIPVIQRIMGIADRYFDSRAASEIRIPLLGTVRATEGAIGTSLLAFLILINLGQVALSVRFNFFSRDMFNALQAKDGPAFWYQLLWIFVPLAAVYISVALVEIVSQYVLRIRWRAFLNGLYVREWLGDGTHYRMQLVGREADNPDQRIADDLRNYVDQTYTLSIGLLNQSATLVSFIAILWALSRDFTLPGTDIPVPGLLVWVAILYAMMGTWLTHVIGRPLIGLYFRQERVEADYRFSLARLREYTEQVALLNGEEAEKEALGRRFGMIVDNFMRIVRRVMNLTIFQAGYFQANVVVPYILTAPYYFIDRISLGQMQQTVGAFSSVQGALDFFITSYSTIASYKAVVDRLLTFEASIESVRRRDAETHVELVETPDQDLKVSGLTVALPDGRALMRADGIAFRQGETTLLTGPSGSGKSTLFRAISGIWPFGEGQIRIPAGQSMMLLPQRPYIPMGTLRAAVTYPGMQGVYDDAVIREALRAARLPALADRLDEERAWAQTLSLGEQQRLAIARALLARPDWLFLDEATAALDEPTEAEIYAMLKAKLPETTIVSIGHRSTLAAFHDRRIDMRRQDDGLYAPVDLREPQPAE
ncbi:ABC transporter ATP-binding protein/permease [Microvirga thermotolerans]|uniref:ATP-binding cassette domain-containing protein n=1 Tax=Microvirga thermotolerans TaxID=2651334 RepID=A0A5P9JSD5_9HYPH|nr:ABC transporter ATP-binding protein/permease [Microvirga thermotolerans]QFU15702.1 ATP-binding cassette domain-containing protein [Microvirga thermotolerans]